GVRGEKQRVRVHQFGEDDDRVVFGPDAVEALTYRIRRRTGEAVHERVDAAHEVQAVIYLTDGVCARCAVLEFERTDDRLNLVRRSDLRGDCGVRLRHAGQCQRGAGCEQG